MNIKLIASLLLVIRFKINSYMRGPLKIWVSYGKLSYLCSARCRRISEEIAFFNCSTNCIYLTVLVSEIPILHQNTIVNNQLT